jgi:anti-anti-sigma factor
MPETMNTKSSEGGDALAEHAHDKANEVISQGQDMAQGQDMFKSRTRCATRIFSMRSGDEETHKPSGNPPDRLGDDGEVRRALEGHAAGNGGAGGRYTATRGRAPIAASRASCDGARDRASPRAVEVADLRPFAIEVRRRDEVAIVQSRGELDLVSVETLRAALDGIKSAARLVLDLRGLSFIDSTDMHLLVALHQRAQRDGFQLTLLAPAAPLELHLVVRPPGTAGLVEAVIRQVREVTDDRRGNGA